MRSFGFAAAAAALVLWPAVGSAEDWTKDSAPFVASALSQPMSGLVERARGGDPNAALTLGLAMLAGRFNPASLDETPLAALETRMLPLVDAHVKAHPGESLATVNWSGVANETRDEARFVDHYEQVHSADYWLERAVFSVVKTEVPVPQRPNPKDYGENTVGTPAFARGTMTSSAIDINLIFTAAHCIVAVRRAAGMDYQPWGTLPLSVRLLQHMPRQDMQARVDGDLAGERKDLHYPTGAAACGSDDQFQADVAALKAAG